MRRECEGRKIFEQDERRRVCGVLGLGIGEKTGRDQ